jgi:nucleoid DNA-binding protein
VSLSLATDICILKDWKHFSRDDRIILSIHDRRWSMNKADLVNEVAKVVSTRKEAQAAVDCVFDTIINALKGSDQVTVVGFGTFKVSNRKARTGRNPKTGEAIMIKASNVPKFMAGKALKDAVEESSGE